VEVAVRVVLLLLDGVVVLKRAHLSAVVAIENAHFLLDRVEAALAVVHQLMHHRHDSLSHHRRVEAQNHARVALQLQQQLRVAWPPKVLVLFEFVVVASAAVLRVGPEEQRAAKVNQDEHSEFSCYLLL